MNSKKIGALAMVAAWASLGSGAAQATLHDRGSGLVYDDVLNITWLANAQPLTAGVINYGVLVTNTQGQVSFDDALTIASNFTYDYNGVTLSDWRLPFATDFTPSNPGPSGGVKVGCDISGLYAPSNGSECGSWSPGVVNGTVYNELSYMYHQNLGFTSELSAVGVVGSDYGINWDGTAGNRAEVNDLGPNGAIDHLQDSIYWTSTHFVLGTTTIRPYAFGFDTDLGRTNQYQTASGLTANVWLVMDGDVVSSVPEPMTAAMAGVGIAMMLLARRRFS